MKIDEIAKENPNWNNAGNEKLNNPKKKKKTLSGKPHQRMGHVENRGSETEDKCRNCVTQWRSIMNSKGNMNRK